MAEHPQDLDEALADEQAAAGPDADPAEPTIYTPEDAEAPAAADEPTGEAPTAEDRLAAAEDRALRLQAELQNVLGRARREVAEERKYGAVGLARDLLPAIDNIDRALEAASNEGAEASGLIDGFRMVREQLVGALARHGCEAIPTEPGTEFDPTFHEAILQQPSEKVPAGRITMAAQTGYKLHDRVLRAAQVIVSSGPAEG